MYIVPFICFISGYYAMSYLYPIQRMSTPNIIGQSILQALQTVAPLKINLQIIGYKEEADLPEGIILLQNPLPETMLKNKQALYCTVSQKPPVHIAPSVLNKSLPEINNLLNNQKISFKAYYLPNNAPYNICIAQSPEVGNPLEKKSLVLFLSDGNKKPFVWPSFKDRPVEEVNEFLQKHSLKPIIIHRYPVSQVHQCTECRVINQRPLAGTFIHSFPEGLKTIQLEVS